MNALVAHPETGFLESESHSYQTFDNEKKVKFLEMIQAHIRDTGKWPDMSSVCDAIGIGTRTLERHIKSDPKFAEAYRSVTLRGKHKLESLMYDLAGKNPMYLFGWLRKHFPEEYNPDHKVTIDHNINVLQSLINKAKDNNDIIDTQAL
jgi:hypothetical protein